MAIISNLEVMIVEAIIMKKTNLIALMVVAIAVMGLLVGCVPQQKERTVTATGSAEITADPDEAVVYLRIETTGATAQEAKDANAEIADDVTTALIKTGLTMDDIETVNYNIWEDFDWVNGEQISKGFRATHNMKVTTTEFDDVGDIVDAAVDAGALISYINFEMSLAKQNEYKAIAFAEASKDAKNKAQAIASGLDKELGELVEVGTSDYGYMPWRAMETVGMEASAVKAAATEISPEKITVSGTVTVVYQIK
jgi:uncharacterized protein YggE